MSEIAIIMTPDGMGHAIHTEAIDLARIGKLSIRRATRIEFDDRTQSWRVFPAHGRKAIYHSPSRQECLDWERRYLTSQEDMKHALQHGSDSVAAGAGVDGREGPNTRGCASGLQ